MKSAKAIPHAFETEAALCQAFGAWVRVSSPEWVIYPETCGWDMVVVHRSGGWQIGIEAKLTLNAKVLAQAIDRRNFGRGPDFRAVLVGKVVAENAVLASALGLTVISPAAVPYEPDWGGWAHAPKRKQGPKIPEFRPQLPEAEKLVRIGDWWSNPRQEVWKDEFPQHRLVLPDYVPEVAAGVPAPLILSDWKIKAMRICVWVEKHGSIDRAVFRALGIDPSRWMNGHWLAPGQARGKWVAGPAFPADQMRREHGNIFARVEQDYPKWSLNVATQARGAA